MARQVMSPETKANMTKATNARNAAIKRLITNHRDEYNNILGDIRVSEGLPREQTNVNPAKLQERKTRLETQLRKLNEQLGIT